jgi:prevent-host-death family protein
VSERIVISARELRDRLGEILRVAEAGGEFTITVRGRPVARVGPPDSGSHRAIDIPVDRLRRMLADTPVDDGFASVIAALRTAELPAEDSCSSR